MFVRGQAGWTRSAVGCWADNDIAEDGDLDASCSLDSASGAGTDAKLRAQNRIPLCEQAELQVEANAWAHLWGEGAQYELGLDLGGEQRLRSLWRT